MSDWFSNRVMFPVVVSLSATMFLGGVVLYGSRSAQLVVATVFSCWAGLVTYAAVSVPVPGDAISTRLLLGACTYAFVAFGLAMLVTLPFLPSIARAMKRQMDGLAA